MIEFEYLSLNAMDIESIDLSDRFAAFDQTRTEPGMPETLAGWPGLSVFEGQTLIAIGGLIPNWPGRAQIWMASSRAARPRHYLKLISTANWLVDIGHKRGATRIEAYVRDNNASACRWIEKIGFNFEGVMRMFGMAGEDFRLYAHIEEGS